jgi:hypothetical protein
VAGIGSRIGRLGRRVLAAHRPPPRTGGIRLARAVASRHRPPLLEAATRLARAHRRGPAAAPPRAQVSAVRDPHLTDFAMEWMFGAGDLTDFAVEGVPEAEGPPSFLPAAPEPPAVVKPSEPAPRFEEFGPFRLSPVPAVRAEDVPPAAPENGVQARAQEAPAASEPAQEPPQREFSTPPAEQKAALAGREQAKGEAPGPTPVPRAAPQPLSIRRVERPAASPTRPVVARRRREAAPPSPTTLDAPPVIQPVEAPSRPLLTRIVSHVFRRRPSPPTGGEPVRAEEPAAEQPRVLARRAGAVPEPVREQESFAVPGPGQPVSPEPEPVGVPALQPEPEPEAEPEVEVAVDSVSVDVSEAPVVAAPAPRVVLQRVERTEPRPVEGRAQPVARVERARGPSSRETATPPSQPLRALRRAVASVARLPRAAVRREAPPPSGPPAVPRAAVAEPAIAEELPAVTALEPVRVERRPEPLRLRSVARADSDRARQADRFVQRATATSLAAATGGTLAREAAELASVTFAPPPEPHVREPAFAPVLARAPDDGQTVPPAPAATPAPEAPAPHAAHDPGVDYDQIYDHVIRRLRRDLLREREQMGDLLGDLY